MRRFKRRKPRVIWLPVYGRDFSDGTPENFGNGIGGSVAANNTGAIGTDIQPVTFDYSDSASAEEGVEGRSLQDLTSGNAYRLRRIVGKFHAAATMEGNALAEVPLIDLAAGFMVCRTDSSGNVVTTEQDASGNITGGPLAEDGAEDPWIWRRRWLLSPVPTSLAGEGISYANIVATQTLLGGQGQFPPTTAHYGSVQDGPHIDQKTARIISREERLTFWVQARTVNASESQTNNGGVVWQLDLRLLASLRSQQGNRRNASR